MCEYNFTNAKIEKKKKHLHCTDRVSREENEV